MMSANSLRLVPRSCQHSAQKGCRRTHHVNRWNAELHTGRRQALTLESGQKAESCKRHSMEKARATLRTVLSVRAHVREQKCVLERWPTPLNAHFNFLVSAGPWNKSYFLGLLAVISYSSCHNSELQNGPRFIGAVCFPICCLQCPLTPLDQPDPNHTTSHGNTLQPVLPQHTAPRPASLHPTKPHSTTTNHTEPHNTTPQHTQTHHTAN